MCARALAEVQAAAEEAAAAEFFQTPSWVVECLLRGGGPPLPDAGTWLDPCAGLGAIPRAVSRVVPGVSWRLCELREECSSALEGLPGVKTLVIGDFFHGGRSMLRCLPLAEVVIFNSPFSRTVEFVEHGWRLGYWVVSLQRANWVGSQARASWLRRHMPDRYALPKRPSFRADGATDGCEYEWHVWPPGPRERRDGLTRMLAMPTSQVELFA